MIESILASGFLSPAVLKWVSLGLLCFALLVMVYGVIYIHDIPYKIAVKRNHPHADAIHVAGWVSLFTLHAIWPFLWIWAYVWKPGKPIATINVQNDAETKALENLSQQVADLKAELEVLKAQSNKSDNA